MEEESFPLEERLSTVGVWRYPKMIWTQAVATTTLPLSTAGEDVRGGECLERRAVLASSELGHKKRLGDRLEVPSKTLADAGAGNGKPLLALPV